MASSALSTFKLSSPFLSQRNNGVKPPPSAFSPLRSYTPNVKSMAVSPEGRDNLDYLQKSNRVQQAQPKKKTPTPAAPVGLWDRFPNARTVQQMMDTMERLIEDPRAYNNNNNTWVPPREDINGGYRGGRTPWEIKEVGNEYKIRFDMPGMTKNDVKVWVEEKMLVVKGEKVGKENGEGAREEEEVWPTKSYGKYSSRIALPENVEMEKIKAEVRDGVLYISIPKVTVSSKVLDIQVQ